MASPSEIYVRHGGGTNMLNAYGDASGLVEMNPRGEPVAFMELTVLPEWIEDAQQKALYEKMGTLLRLRFPIHSVAGFVSSEESE